MKIYKAYKFRLYLTEGHSYLCKFYIVLKYFVNLKKYAIIYK